MKTGSAGVMKSCFEANFENQKKVKSIAISGTSQKKRDQKMVVAFGKVALQRTVGQDDLETGHCRPRPATHSRGEFVPNV